MVARGNFEEGSWQQEIGNRAEAPDAFMMRCLIAEATAFLNATLIGHDDGIYNVKRGSFFLETR